MPDPQFTPCCQEGVGDPTTQQSDWWEDTVFAVMEDIQREEPQLPDELAFRYAQEWVLRWRKVEP